MTHLAADIKWCKESIKFYDAELANTGATAIKSEKTRRNFRRIRDGYARKLVKLQRREAKEAR